MKTQVLIILVLISNFETIVCGSFLKDVPKLLDSEPDDSKPYLDKETKHSKHTGTKELKPHLDKESKHSKHTGTKELKPHFDPDTEDLKPSFDKESKHFKHTDTKELKPFLDPETEDLKPSLDKETKHSKHTGTKELKPHLDIDTEDLKPSLDKETKHSKHTNTEDFLPSLDKETKHSKHTNTKESKPRLDTDTEDFLPFLDTDTEDFKPSLDKETKDCEPSLVKETKDFPYLDSDTKNLKASLDKTKDFKPSLDTDTTDLKSSLDKEINVWEPSSLKETKVWKPPIDQKFPKTLSSDVEPINKDCVPDLNNLKNVFHNKYEDRNLDDFKFLTKHGLEYEVHFVKTCDGYVLKFVRIPGKGPVVLLTHGVVSSFIDFFTSGTKSGLGFVLHRAGYDLWLANCRGNTFSRNHTKLSPEDKEFWDFSFHEIGTRDLPAFIDYALCKTGEKQLTYIGHSQGTTSVMVLLSKKPEYNKKIKLVIMLSPVAFMNHAKSPIFRAIALLKDQIKFFVSTFGHNELLPRDGFVSAVKNIICFPVTTICSKIMFLLSGYDWAQLNHTALPTQYGHVPSGVSLKQVMHYAQEFYSKRFCEYDYGEEKNLIIYRKKLSPDYNLTNIRAPVAIFRAKNDWLADPRDVKKLIKKLPNVVLDYVVPFCRFNHMDFLWAKDVKKLVYMKILEVIEKYNNNC